MELLRFRAAEVVSPGITKAAGFKDGILRRQQFSACTDIFLWYIHLEAGMCLIPRAACLEALNGTVTQKKQMYNECFPFVFG